ncbi:hypothetical protein BH23ACT9_BH23ACT9_38330 [soil metagenome]
MAQVATLPLVARTRALGFERRITECQVLEVADRGQVLAVPDKVVAVEVAVQATGSGADAERTASTRSRRVSTGVP